MEKSKIFQTFPVENYSMACYNIASATNARDAAGKGKLVLCHTTDEKAALELFTSLPLEAQREGVSLLKSLASAQPQAIAAPCSIDDTTE